MWRKRALVKSFLSAAKRNIQTTLEEKTFDNASFHSAIAEHDFKKMKVKVIPALKDNYMYLLIDKETNEAAAIDPVDASSMSKYAQEESTNLTKILTTHHHWDHASGNEKLTKLTKNPLKVYGADFRIQGLTDRVKHLDTINVGSLKVQVLFTPCHTAGHVCYAIKSNDDKIVFTGDALFQGGCGRFFEGTADEAYCSICQKLYSLSDDTQVFCGHEYTVPNLKFAYNLEPSNSLLKDRLAWAEMQRERRQPTVPSTIGQEKKWNPFMRVREPSIQQVIGQTNPIEVMNLLRLERNNFKAN